MVDICGGINKITDNFEMTCREIFGFEYVFNFECGFDFYNHPLEDIEPHMKENEAFMDGYNAGILCFSTLGE